MVLNLHRVRICVSKQRRAPALRRAARATTQQSTTSKKGTRRLPSSTRRLSAKLVPGMPAEAYIKTGERTLASYLMKPLLDQMQRAMREDW